MTTSEQHLPQPGEIWRQRQTAEMRRDRVERHIKVNGYGPPSRGVTTLLIGPAPGFTGRQATIGVGAFLRKFEPVDSHPKEA